MEVVKDVMENLTAMIEYAEATKRFADAGSLKRVATEIETLRAKVAELEALLPVCPRCNGEKYDPEPEPVCCGSYVIVSEHMGQQELGCCGSPEPDFGPCRDCGGTGAIATPQPVKVPGGWEVLKGDDGAIIVEHSIAGGFSYLPDGREYIIIWNFLNDLLAAQES